MRALPLLLVVLGLVLGACSSSSESPPAVEQSVAERPRTDQPQETSAQAVDPAAGEAAPPSCCSDYDQLRQLDGSRVTLQGTYQKVVVSKRPGAVVDTTTGGTASVTVGALSIMLGVYYESSGARSADEVARFHGNTVTVVGTIHAQTPTQVFDGVPAQTMIGPYIEVDSLTLAP